MSSQNQSPRFLPLFNKTQIFTSADHRHNVSIKMQTFYEKKAFCDVVLIAGDDDVQVHAHKLVLSASSDFFLTMFSSDLAEASADEVEIRAVDGLTMKLIIDFMYTGSIELRSDTVEIILKVADYFQMNDLVDACCDFMGQQVDASNCLGVSFFAEQHRFTKLEKKASSFAYANFEKACAEKEFLQLNEERLIKFLSSDDLCTHSEEQVFYSVVAWLEYDRANREKFTLRLLANVRFTLLEAKFIVENRHLVCKTIESYELICSWLQWHLSPESRSNFSTEETKARKESCKLAFASGERISNLKVQTFDAVLNTWSFEDLPSPPTQKSHYSMIVINRKLLVVGGEIDGFETNCVECLDMQTNEWTNLSPMAFRRSYPALANLEGDLYVVGGYRGENWLCSVEKYDFSTCKWENMAPLPLPFEWVRVAVHNRLLYAVGDEYPFMECYDPDANVWNQKANKNENSILFGFAAVGEHIYAVGGYQQENESSSKAVERYNPCTDTWTPVNSLQMARDEIRCVALGNRLIACGGIADTNYVDLVEEYNPETDDWNTLAPLLPHELNYDSSNLFTI